MLRIQGLVKLIGWDSKKQVESLKIFEVPISYGFTIEEQGKTTLYAHNLVWIKDFNKVKDQLFSNDIATKMNSKKEMIKYVDKAMYSTHCRLKY